MVFIYSIAYKYITLFLFKIANNQIFSLSFFNKAQNLFSILLFKIFMKNSLQSSYSKTRYSSRYSTKLIDYIIIYFNSYTSFFSLSVVYYRYICTIFSEILVVKFSNFKLNPIKDHSNKLIFYKKNKYKLLYLFKNAFYTIVCVSLAVLIYYYLLSLRLYPASKLLFSHFVLFNFVYLLISGFVFFFKKYRYNRYTSVIQRFWKRSYILFWLLESAIFITFLYLTLNASEEPFYMYDQIKFYKTHLYSWRSFIILSIMYLLLILFTYSLQYYNKWSYYDNIKYLVVFITILFLFIVLGEFYQFYHIIGFYTNLSWVFDYDENYWSLDMEYRRTRLSNNYTIVCLLAKFWHLVFIAGFWFFFVLRSLEVKRFGHLAISANIQNFIILYLMLWLYMYPWFKFIFRKFLHMSYYWFGLDQRSIVTVVLYNDVFNYFIALKNNFKLFFIMWDNYKQFYNFSFFYWIETSSILNFTVYKKHIIRDYFVNNFLL